MHLNVCMYLALHNEARYRWGAGRGGRQRMKLGKEQLDQGKRNARVDIAFLHSYSLASCLRFCDVDVVRLLYANVGD